jgi:hypothetical protein
MRLLRANQHKSNLKRSKNSTFWANEAETTGLQGEAEMVTWSRLHQGRTEVVRASRPLSRGRLAPAPSRGQSLSSAERRNARGTLLDESALSP